MPQRNERSYHRLLSALHAVVALNAIGGGCYGLAGAQGIPLAWLDGTPFASYRTPSLILLVVVGGLQGSSCVLVWRQSARAHVVSLVAGIVLLGWIGVQVAMIGYLSWLQPAVGLMAVINITLAKRLGRMP